MTTSIEPSWFDAWGALVAPSSVPEVLEALADVCSAEAAGRGPEQGPWAATEDVLRRALEKID